MVLLIHLQMVQVLQVQVKIQEFMVLQLILQEVQVLLE